MLSEVDFGSTIDQVREVIEGFRNQVGAAEMERTEADGVLTIDDLGIDPITFVQDSLLLAQRRQDEALGLPPSVQAPSGSSGDAAARMLGIIYAAASPDSNTYPLFDKNASAKILDLAREEPNAVSRIPGRHVGLPTAFIKELPAFPAAPMDEILDARRSAAPALAVFRSAMAGMALEVGAAAWEPGFAHEANALFDAEVSPAVDQIKSDLHEMGFIQLLTHAARTHTPYTATAATVGLALAGAEAVPDMAAIAMAGAPVVGILGALVEGYKEKLRLKRPSPAQQVRVVVSRG